MLDLVVPAAIMALVGAHLVGVNGPANAAAAFLNPFVLLLDNRPPRTNETKRRVKEEQRLASSRLQESLCFVFGRVGKAFTHNLFDRAFLPKVEGGKRLFSNSALTWINYVGSTRRPVRTTYSMWPRALSVMPASISRKIQHHHQRRS